ncbi:carbohydrate-binding protein [Herbidospora mongoliensis]|uniref:carbohydrate-binding protein n=1 Tax=Herbidospora mongoliensis TaxID=688067 RepID=UPI000AE84D3D|nr:carbohydrate-binding protein [Herbidospora mongoliensis]
MSRPFTGAPQRIPGRVMCAFYDLGGEGVAYHDRHHRNHGSGGLNPIDGSYLNDFRADENVGTSYTKPDGIDNHPYQSHRPDMGMLYVGWTTPGNWLRYTVEVAEPGEYEATLLYAAAKDGSIRIDLDDDIGGEVELPSTGADDDIEWRRWHHWALVRFELPWLAAGRHVLTLRTTRTGEMNYAYLDFSRLGGRANGTLAPPPS